MTSLYKVRTAKYFEQADGSQSDAGNSGDSGMSGTASKTAIVVPGLAGDPVNPLAIQRIDLCTDSRRLVVTGSLHVIVLSFNKREQSYEIPVVDVSIVYSFPSEPDIEENLNRSIGVGLPHQSTSIGSYSSNDKRLGFRRLKHQSVSPVNFNRSFCASSKMLDPTGGVYCGPPEWEDPETPPSRPALPHQSVSVGSYSSNVSASEKEMRVSVAVRTGSEKWPVGYQPELICRLGTQEVENSPPVITAVAFSSGYGLLALGNDCGIAVVDTVQKTLIISTGTPELYGSLDPYTRIAWSPNNKRDDKSPSVEPVNGLNLSGGLPPSTAVSASSAASSLHMTGLRSPGVITRSSAASRGELKRTKSQDKSAAELRDFSRSCSSSMSSLENISFEAIRSLTFIESFPRKYDYTSMPSLWIGTSLGTVLSISIQIPESRDTQNVTLTSSGSMFRLRGEITCVSFLDCSGDLATFQSTRWEDTARSSSGLSSVDKKDTAAPSMASIGRQTTLLGANSCNEPPGPGPGDSDRQFAVFCSEKQVRVVSLPSQAVAFKAKITETSSVILARVVRMKAAPFLAVYLANGHLMAFSLPSLRMLMDVDYQPVTDRLVQTFHFAHNGHAMFFSSPTEMNKITLSAEICSNLKEMLGELFITCEMPEVPKRNFFQNLFSGTISSPLDRDELFGEASSGKASSATCSYIPNPKMDKLNLQSGGAASEIARAKQAAIERGERLSQLDKQTEEMMNEAKSFSRNTTSLASKFEKKDKRWGLPF